MPCNQKGSDQHTKHKDTKEKRIFNRSRRHGGHFSVALEAVAEDRCRERVKTFLRSEWLLAHNPSPTNDVGFRVASHFGRERYTHFKNGLRVESLIRFEENACTADVDRRSFMPGLLTACTKRHRCLDWKPRCSRHVVSLGMGQPVQGTFTLFFNHCQHQLEAVGVKLKSTVRSYHPTTISAMAPRWDFGMARGCLKWKRLMRLRRSAGRNRNSAFERQTVVHRQEGKLEPV